MSELEIWTVYDKGTDGDDTNYIARLWTVDGSGAHPTGDVMQAVDLEYIRGMFRIMGLVQVERREGDAFNIVESWL